MNNLTKKLSEIYEECNFSGVNNAQKSFDKIPENINIRDIIPSEFVITKFCNGCGINIMRYRNYRYNNSPMSYDEVAKIYNYCSEYNSRKTCLAPYIKKQNIPDHLKETFEAFIKDYGGVICKYKIVRMFPFHK